MMNASIHQERTLAEVKRLSLAGFEGPKLLRQAAERLKLAVPFEAYCASTVDPASNLITHSIAEGIGDEEERSEAGAVFFDRVYFEEDLDQIAAMLRDGRPVQLLSEATGGELDHSLRYRELLRPLGFGNELGSLFIEGSLWSGMDLIREASGPEFSSEEVALMKRVAPHVGAGLKAAALRSRATVEPAPDGTPGVLTLDPGGRVISHTHSAERLLSEREGLGLAWRERHGLPVAVRMMAVAVRRSLAPRSDRDLDLIPRLRVRARSGRWLTLYGSITESAFGPPSETVVVIEHAKPEEVTWVNVAAYGLSPREEEVVKLVVRGLSTKQISQTLFISGYTVQRHLSNVFEKVGVRSRRALLKRLFFDDLLPGTHGE